jgi:hypothetical protein
VPEDNYNNFDFVITLVHPYSMKFRNQQYCLDLDYFVVFEEGKVEVQVDTMDRY